MTLKTSFIMIAYRVVFFIFFVKIYKKMKPPQPNCSKFEQLRPFSLENPHKL